MPVTIKDIAELAHVSKATVSRVLRQNPNVSKATSERVLEAARSLGYKIPRKPAVSRVIMVTTHQSTLRDPFFLPIIEGLEAGCRSAGFTLSISAFTEGRPDVDKMAHGAQGIIVLGTSGITEGLLRDLAGTRIPGVLINTAVRQDMFCYVGTEDRNAMFDVVSHLVAKGHREITFLSGPEDDLINLERRKGFQLGLLNAGIAFKEEWISEPGNWDIESGYVAAKDLLKRLDGHLTAIVSANDRMALGAYRAIKEIGLAIPDDISVVGFDDIEMAAHADPPLSSVTVPQTAMGEWAIQLLMTMQINPDRIPVRVHVPTRIVFRESVAERRRK